MGPTGRQGPGRRAQPQPGVGSVRIRSGFDAELRARKRKEGDSQNSKLRISRRTEGEKGCELIYSFLRTSYLLYNPGLGCASLGRLVRVATVGGTFPRGQPHALAAAGSDRGAIVLPRVVPLQVVGDRRDAAEFRVINR